MFPRFQVNRRAADQVGNRPGDGRGIAGNRQVDVADLPADDNVAHGAAHQPHIGGNATNATGERPGQDREQVNSVDRPVAIGIDVHLIHHRHSAEP